MAPDVGKALGHFILCYSNLFVNDSSVPYGSYENVDVVSQWFVDVGSLLVHAGGSRVVRIFVAVDSCWFVVGSHVIRWCFTCGSWLVRV